MGRETVGSGRDTQLWSGGQEVGEQYQDVSNIGEIEATMRGRRTLEMTARHTLKPWDCRQVSFISYKLSDMNYHDGLLCKSNASSRL